MLFGLFRRRSEDRAQALYAGAVAAARAPVFYERYAVADTVEGRLEMVMLHVGLLVERLSGADGDRDLARAVSEAFFADMDRTLREMGIGDLSVPKKMKSVASAFYGRLRAYADAGEEASLTIALARNVYDAVEHPAAGALARHVRAVAVVLASTDMEDIAAGRFALPDPAAALSEETDR
jgi:cytochrome b pre-mRNA-processing protein 3